MPTIPFRHELHFDYGAAARVSPLVRRVIARNPSMFTLYGTGTYIVGRGEVAIIDPGPDLAEHVDAILAAVEGEVVTHLVITHTHLDHSPATSALQAATGARSYGFGPHGTRDSDTRVEAGADYDFEPDQALEDGDLVRGRGWTLEAIHTPGHTSNHLCLALREENSLFSGDHVMGWSTTVVSPPDGNMPAYVASLRKLAARSETRVWPTHGPPIDDPRPFLHALVGHREEREAQILMCLRDGVGEIPEMVRRIYADVDPQLHYAAAHSVLAHLLGLLETDRVRCEGEAGVGSRFVLRGR
jgi:glyoxylase-like metal-dependent hydrolase (beta-lactamase superfamily II)